MTKRIKGTLAVFMALVILAPVTVLAQGTTGTIRGKVTDQATNEPLAAVNVSVVMPDGTLTQMGNFSNAEGDYVIINVPPGRYTLRATMMGYKTTEVTEMLVTVGVSTPQNFVLEPTVLDVGEVVTIVAERELIQRDVTAMQQSYSIEQMERMAVSNTTEILTLQTNTYAMEGYDNMISGYRDRGLEQIHMRGGRNAEVAFMIDGMQITNLVFGGQAARVSAFSLSEMVVMAGGMSAEFGNAMSGVVNMVTREGGTRYNANVELMSSELTGVPQDDVMDLNNLQAYFGGPVPTINRLTFFLSGSVRATRDYLLEKDGITYDFTPSTPDPNITYYDSASDTNPYSQTGIDGRPILPVDLYSGFLGTAYDDTWDGMINLTYKITANTKINVSGGTNGRWGMPYTQTWRYSILYGLPSDVQEALRRGQLVEGGTDYTTDRIPGTGILNWPNEKNALFENNGRLAAVFTQQLNQSTFYTIRGSYYKYNRTMRVKRWINAAGWNEDYNKYFVSTGDPNWTPEDPMTQITLSNQIWGGYNSADYISRAFGYAPYGTSYGWTDGSDRYYTDHVDLTRTLKADVTSQISSHHQLKAGFLYNGLTLDQNDYQILWYTPPYITTYRHSPWELGLYAQDKVEYDFVIINLGLRYDSSFAGKIPYWSDARNPMNPDNPNDVIEDPFGPDAPVQAGKVRGQISPRLGLSHPVTDQAVIYFNYGHFFQNPIYRNLYITGTLNDAVPLIGNPNMSNEKTVSYEFGYKHQFTDIYAVELTLWSKDTSNMVGSETVPAWYGGMLNPYEYTVFLNYDYAESKGVDLSLIKRYSGYFSGQFNYSFQTTMSNRDDPWSGYRNGDTLETSPKRPRVLGWDQPHRFSVQVSVQIPEGVGPALGGIRPLEKTSASVIFRASSGRPYTPTTRTENLEPNSGRLPWTSSWDLRLYRDFATFGMRYSVFANISNLLNQKNVYTVYARTGKPDDPGPDATSYSDGYDRSNYWSPPRRINLGLRIFF
jgi:hypothetical protein